MGEFNSPLIITGVDFLNVFITTLCCSNGFLEYSIIIKPLIKLSTRLLHDLYLRISVLKCINIVLLLSKKNLHFSQWQANEKYYINSNLHNKCVK
jgi:hypothetical protein